MTTLALASDPLLILELDGVRERRHLGARAARDLADWSAYLAAEEKADRTRVDYVRTAARLVIWRDKELSDYTDGDINAFLSRWPAGTQSRRSYTYALRSLFAWAKFTRRISENPMEYVPVPRLRSQRLVQTFSDAEVMLLCSQDPLMRVLFDTGLRKGEAANLQRRHIDLAEAELAVYDGKGGKDRVVPLTRKVVAVIADLDLVDGLDRQSAAFIWGCRPGGAKRLDRSRRVADATMDRWFVRTLEAAGVEYRSRATGDGLHNFHVTRHTFATRYLRTPGARIERLSKILGHSSIDVTFDTYGHLDTRDLKEDMALFEEAYS